MINKGKLTGHWTAIFLSVVKFTGLLNIMQKFKGKISGKDATDILKKLLSY